MISSFIRLRHYKIVVIFGSITNRGSNLNPYDSHQSTITTKPRLIANKQNNQVFRRIGASIVSIFSVFRRMVGRIRNFFSLKPFAPQYGNHPSKLHRVCRFGGVREQTEKQTNSLTSSCLKG